jgi:NAD(P)-dependent dehydrogenase (short-subunit alcohol dehydrogenase family)
MTESSAKPASEPGGSAAATDTGGFAGQAALLTGASAIGLATARMLARRGACVAVLDPDSAEAEPGLVSVLADMAHAEAVKSTANGLIAAPEDAP